MTIARELVVAAALWTTFAASSVRAGEPCRRYKLTDLDSGERVEGCVTYTVRATGAKAIQVAPAMQGGVRFGWRVTDLARSDMLARIGVRPGDVILTLNGYDMAAQTSPQIIAEVLGRDDELVVTVGSKPRSSAPRTAQQVVQLVDRGKGVTLGTVPPGSFFASIGLKPGDTVKSIAGQPVTDAATLARLAEQAQQMDEVHVVVVRGGQELDLLVKSR